MMQQGRYHACYHGLVAASIGCPRPAANPAPGHQQNQGVTALAVCLFCWVMGFRVYSVSVRRLQ